MIFKYTVLILVLIKITLSYKHCELIKYINNCILPWIMKMICNLYFKEIHCYIHTYFSDEYLELLCPEQKYKDFFEKFTNNIPEVKLGQGIESAALMNYRSNGTNHKKIGSCKFDVKVDVGSGNGIFASIKNLKLRENTNVSYGEDSCVDYVRFTYKNGTSTTPLCGNVETSVHNNLIRNFFGETSGEMRVEVFISENSLSSSETIVVDLVFTAYSRKF